MRVVVICLMCLLLAVPASAQQSQQRQNTERKATVILLTGIGLAGPGILMMLGSRSGTYPGGGSYGGGPTRTLGTTLTIAGAGMIGYSIHLNRKAKAMPSTTFGVVPLKNGVAFGVNRSW